MKSKHFVTLFFVVGLIFAVAAMVNLPVGSAYADSSDGGNAVEKLMGNPPEILKNSCPDTLKALMDAAAAGKLTDSSSDRAVSRAAGNNDVVMSISPAAFHSLATGSTPCDLWFLANFASSNYCGILSGINLPDGAEVYKIELISIDNNASLDETVSLMRVKDDLSYDVAATVSTSGQSTDIRKFSNTTIAFPTVVLSDYSYWLQALIHTDIASLTVRIYYHPNTDATFKSIAIK